MLRGMGKLKWRFWLAMNKRGIIGGFIAMFVATVVIVLILLVMIIGSGIVKKFVATKDNFGIQNESAVGIDDVFDYSGDQFYNVTKLRSYTKGRFDDMVQLRIIVREKGDWEGWLTEEMKR